MAVSLSVIIYHLLTRYLTCGRKHSRAASCDIEEAIAKLDALKSDVAFLLGISLYSPKSTEASAFSHTCRHIAQLLAVTFKSRLYLQENGICIYETS